jgi:hypothetical protein
MEAVIYTKSHNARRCALPFCAASHSELERPVFALSSVLHLCAVLVNRRKGVPKHSGHFFEVPHHAEACMASCYTVYLSQLREHTYETMTWYSKVDHFHLIVRVQGLVLHHLEVHVNPLDALRFVCSFDSSDPEGLLTLLSHQNESRSLLHKSGHISTPAPPN